GPFDLRALRAVQLCRTRARVRDARQPEGRARREVQRRATRAGVYVASARLGCRNLAPSRTRAFPVAGLRKTARTCGPRIRDPRSEVLTARSPPAIRSQRTPVMKIFARTLVSFLAGVTLCGAHWSQANGGGGGYQGYACLPFVPENRIPWPGGVYGSPSQF